MNPKTSKTEDLLRAKGETVIVIGGWEEEVRVGSPWTQDGRSMLVRIRELITLAESRGYERGLAAARESCKCVPKVVESADEK